MNKIKNHLTKLHLSYCSNNNDVFFHKYFSGVYEYCESNLPKNRVIFKMGNNKIISVEMGNYVGFESIPYLVSKAYMYNGDSSKKTYQQLNSPIEKQLEKHENRNIENAIEARIYEYFKYKVISIDKERREHFKRVINLQDSFMYIANYDDNIMKIIIPESRSKIDFEKYIKLYQNNTKALELIAEFKKVFIEFGGNNLCDHKLILAKNLDINKNAINQRFSRIRKNAEKKENELEEIHQLIISKYRNEGKFAEAISRWIELSKMLTNEHNLLYWRILFNINSCNIYLKNYKEALDGYKSMSIGLQSPHIKFEDKKVRIADIHNQIALIYAQGYGEIENGLPWYLKAHKLIPKEEAYSVNITHSYMKLKKDKELINFYKSLENKKEVIGYINKMPSPLKEEIINHLIHLNIL